MSEKIKVLHRETEITYIEATNKWNFELRGRERNTESLTSAREIIDNPESIKKAPFTKVAGYQLNSWYEPHFSKCEVTSIAEEHHVGAKSHVWITSEKGRREKVPADSVILDTPDNKTLRDQYISSVDSVRRLQEEQHQLLKAMEYLVIPRG